MIVLLNIMSQSVHTTWHVLLSFESHDNLSEGCCSQLQFTDEGMRSIRGHVTSAGMKHVWMVNLGWKCYHFNGFLPSNPMFCPRAVILGEVFSHAWDLDRWSKGTKETDISCAVKGKIVKPHGCEYWYHYCFFSLLPSLWSFLFSSTQVSHWRRQGEWLLKGDPGGQKPWFLWSVWLYPTVLLEPK